MANRPGPRITKAQREKLLEALRLGAYIETAAAYAGLGRSTLFEWMRRGRENPTGHYGKLVEEIEHALSTSEVRDLTRIAIASKTEWQASAWRLERRWPERYGRRIVQSEVTGKDGAPLFDSAGLLNALRALGDKGSDEG